MCVAVTTGMVVPIVASTLDIEDPAKKNQVSLLIMTGLGCGEIVGALLIGFLVDKFGS